MGNILRRSQALERDVLQQGLLPGFAHGLPLPFGVGVGAHKSGCNAIDSNVPLSKLMTQLARQAYQCRFGCCVGLDARQADCQTGPAGNVDDAPAAFEQLQSRCAPAGDAQRRPGGF